MPLNITQKADGTILEVEMSGKLTREDFLQYGPGVEQFFAAGKKVSVLVLMRDFHGWDVGALWEELKWDFKHFNRLERVAMVGDKAWEGKMAMFCKPFTSAQVRYFDIKDLSAARDWVEHSRPAMAA